MNEPMREVDPRELRLPPGRAGGADAWKLHQQIRKFGSSKDGMPPILVYEDPDGLFEILDGVTRATRMANWHLEKRSGSLSSDGIAEVERVLHV